MNLKFSNNNNFNIIKNDFNKFNLKTNKNFNLNSTLNLSLNLSLNSDSDSDSNVVKNINNDLNMFNLKVDNKLHINSEMKLKTNINKNNVNKIDNNIILFENVQKIIVLTTNYTYLAAKNIVDYFNTLNINTLLIINNVITDKILKHLNDINCYLFIVGINHLINLENLSNINNKLIIYQIEQLNQLTSPYKLTHNIENIMQNSYGLFDYSNKNLEYYPNNLREKVKIISPLIKEFTNVFNTKTIDILFIGTINTRREKILDKLKQYNISNNLNYTIKIVSQIFDNELIELIKKSKIVINLHYYPNAILEIFRIHDLLSYDCKILSENPGNEEESELIKKYNTVVSFFPIIDDDLSNIDNMYKLISDNLNVKIDFVERKKFIDEINDINKRLLKNNLKNNVYHFITFSTLGMPYDKGINLLNESETIEKIIKNLDNINYYNYNSKNIIENYGIEIKNKYISEHYDISYRCLHHYRGNKIGFWKWKPFIIFEELKKMKYNDILIYYDCNINKNPNYIDEIKNIKYFTNKILNNQDFGFLYEDLNNKNLICENYVKRDIFEKLGCIEKHFKNEPLRRANKLFIRKTKSSENLIYNWLKLTETSLFLPEANEEIMNSAHTNELYGWSTHDQAVLNILYLFYKENNFL